jgi:hypothetical protein
VLKLRMADVAALRLGRTGLETLRPLVGAGPRALGHDRTPDYAFLAVDATGSYRGTLRQVVRSFVFLPNEATLVNCDIAESEPPVPVDWMLEGAEAGRLTIIQPRRAKAAARGRDLVVESRESTSDKLFLTLIHTAARPETGEIDSSDLAGVRLGERVILFVAETRMATAVSFDVAGPAALKFLIAGMAPGAWEIWRGGFLEITDVTVEKESGALSFEGKPGSYFLRHL